MPDLSPRCIGTPLLAETPAYILTAGSFGSGWDASSFFEGFLNTRGRCLEIFWYVNSLPLDPYHIIDAKDVLQGGYIMRLFFTANSGGVSTLRWQWKDGGNVGLRSIDVDLPDADLVGHWWHSVLQFEDDTQASADGATGDGQWHAYHGRVGVTSSSNSAGPSENMPYPYNGTTGIGGIGGGLWNNSRKFLGFRNYSFGGAVEYRIALGVGTQADGTTIIPSTRLDGGFAELRYWSPWFDPNPTPGSPSTPSILEERRNTYVRAPGIVDSPANGSIEVTGLHHCIRFNENFGTLPGGFDRVGGVTSAFDGPSAVVEGEGFFTSPIQEAVGGVEIELFSDRGLSAAASSEPIFELARTRSLNPVADAAASTDPAFVLGVTQSIDAVPDLSSSTENTPALLITRNLLTVEDLAASADGAAPDIFLASQLDAEPNASASDQTLLDFAKTFALDAETDDAVSSDLVFTLLKAALENIVPNADLVIAAEGGLDATMTKPIEPVAALARATESSSIVDQNQFGNSAQNEGIPLGFSGTGGQSFTGDGTEITAVRLLVSRQGAVVSGNMRAEIWEHAGVFGVSSVPGAGPLATSDSFDVTTFVAGEIFIQEFTFATPFQTVNGENYCLVLAGVTGTIGQFVICFTHGDVNAHPGNLFLDNLPQAGLIGDLVFELIGPYTLALAKATQLDAVADLVTGDEGIVELVVASVVLLQPPADLAVSTEGSAPDLLISRAFDPGADLVIAAQDEPDLIRASTLEPVDDLVIANQLLAELTKVSEEVFAVVSDLSVSTEPTFDFQKTFALDPGANTSFATEPGLLIASLNMRMTKETTPIADLSVTDELSFEFIEAVEKTLTPLADLVIANEGAFELARASAEAFTPEADTALATELAFDLVISREMAAEDDAALASELTFDTVTQGVVTLTPVASAAISTEGSPRLLREELLAPRDDKAQSDEFVFADALTRAFALVPVADASLSDELGVDTISQGQVLLTPVADLAQSDELAALGKTFAFDPVADLVAATNDAIDLTMTKGFVSNNTFPVGWSLSGQDSGIDLIVAGRVILVPAAGEISISDQLAGGLLVDRRFDLPTPLLNLILNTSFSTDPAVPMGLAVELATVADLAIADELVVQITTQGEVAFAPVPDTAVSSEAVIAALKSSVLSPVFDLSLTTEGFFNYLIAKTIVAVDDLTGGSGEGGISIDVVIPKDLIPPPSLSTSDELGLGLPRVRRLVGFCQSFSSEGGLLTDNFSTKLLGYSPNHYWKLDEDSGTTVVDHGTDGDGTGTYFLSPTLGAEGLVSDLETSVLFDQALQRGESNNTTSWQTTNTVHSFLVGARFQIDDFSGPNEQFVCIKQAFFEMKVLNDGTLRCIRTTSGAALVTIDSPPGTVVAGIPVQVILAFERTIGGGMRLWVDGQLVAQDTNVAAQNALVLNREWRVAAESDISGEAFNGRIQHVWMMKDRRLVEADILDLFDPEAMGGTVELLVGRGTVPVPDSSSSGEGGAGAGIRIDHRLDLDDDLSQSSEQGVDFVLAGNLDGFVGIIDEVEDAVDPPLCDLEAYLSKLDIWNVAITKLGGLETLTSTTDGVSHALAMAANWDLFKEQMLRDHIWNGAKTTAQLATFKDSDGTTPVVPVGRWSAAFELPATVGREWIRSVRLNGRENRPGDKSRSGLGLWEEEVVWNDVGTGKLCLLCDDTDAKLEYVFKISDNDIDTFMPADMQWAFALSFAVHMASDLGASNADVRDLEAQAEVARRNARRTDGQSGAKTTYVDTSIADHFY